MSEADTTHLMARLAVVEDRVRALVAHRRAGDPDPDDPFRGLYLSDEMVDRLLAPEAEDPAISTDARRDAEDGADDSEARGQVLRLRRLARSARLDEVDVDLLLIALIPDLDSRFERLYGYLNDDVTRRRATIGLALELAGASTLSATDRGRLAGGSSLVDSGLVVVDDADRPFLTRAMRVPDRVAAHLLGDDAPDSALLPYLGTVSAYPLPLASALARALRDGIGVIAIREKDGAVGLCTGVAALAEHGLEAVVLDLNRVAKSGDPLETMSIAAREVILRGGGLVAGPVEALAEVSADAVRRTSRGTFPVVFVGRSTWDPAWADTPPLTLDAPVLAPDATAALWEHHLGNQAGLDHREVVGHLSLGPDQVRRAVEAAQDRLVSTAGR